MSPHKQDVRNTVSWAKRVQYIMPNTSTVGIFETARGVLQGGRVAMSQGNRIPTRGEPLFHEHCLSSTLTAGSNGAAGMDFAHHLC